MSGSTPGCRSARIKVTLEVNGKDVDAVDNVQTHMGDATPVNFDLAERLKKQKELQAAAATGTLTAEQTRSLIGRAAGRDRKKP